MDALCCTRSKRNWWWWWWWNLTLNGMGFRMVQEL
jgi:hypothetical protein